MERPQKNQEAKLSAVVLNDTACRHHHGCRLVMRNLIYALNAIGISVQATSYVGQDWRKNTNFLRAIQICDMIIINGEGTLHHGKEKAELLLRVTQHPDAGGKIKILLNALYEENPKSWLNYLSNFDLIGLRDHRSFKYVQENGFKQAYETSDLSLFFSENILKQHSVRAGIAVSDSILKQKRKTLMSFYKAQKDNGAVFIPIVSATRHLPKQKTGVTQHLDNLRYRGKLCIKSFLDPTTIYYDDHLEYMAAMQNKKLYITGRFHGICLALKTRTPFVALASNSWKMQSLLERIGMENRIVENISKVDIEAEEWQFSNTELENLDRFLNWAQDSWNDFFERLELLGSGKRVKGE